MEDHPYRNRGRENVYSVILASKSDGEKERERGEGERLGSGCVLLNDGFVPSQKSNLIHGPN